MRIAVLGSGLIGNTLAYVLAKRGHEVTVIERQSSSALECSFSNGGQLSYSHVDPWASPDVLPKIVQWLGKKDAPLVFRLRADPVMWCWALQFLRHCTPGKSNYGISTMLRLSHYSETCMDTLLQDANIDFHYKKTGIIRLFSTDKSLEKGIKSADFHNTIGFPFEVLTPAQVLEKEPALAKSSASFAGAMRFARDAVGDAYEFSVALAAHAKELQVDFRYETTITGFETENGQIRTVKTDKGNITADAYVMAIGAETPLLLNKIGVRLPIYPLKGYSASIPITDAANAPVSSVTDMERKIVCTRLGNTLRVAGTAELTGYDTSHTAYRLAPLLRQVKELFPHAGDFSQTTHWACLRPSTPDSIPVLGKTKYKNLFLNTGHGSLGWTLTAGSAYIVADIIEGKQSAIDLDGLTMERFL